MKAIEIDNLGKIPGRRLQANESFSFRCHAELECFNRCCRNLNLFLHPYDVLRLKTNLQISSETFLERYVDVVQRPSNTFPEVVLKMADDQQRSCVFLKPGGCTVYRDRPYTCRNFPLEQGQLFNRASSRFEMVHFFRPPVFCRGPSSHQQWTPQSWAQDQKATEHNRMTVLWADLKRRFEVDPWGSQGPHGPKAKMAFMAVYNLDEFRLFIFQSSFLKRYRVSKNVQKKLRRDDKELLLFGFDWVKLFVWGIKPAWLKRL
jgi:Fe-S-cluster containining protein